MSVVTRSVLLPYTAAEVYTLVSDVARYHEFLPFCIASEVMAMQGQEMRARIAFSWMGLSQSLVTHNRLTPDERIDIEFVSGPFDFLHGQWSFQALSAWACKAHFCLDFQFQVRFLRMAATPAINQAATQTVGAFHHRAEQIYGKR